MVDTPSSILLLRLQATGSNTNLWGGYLNTAMQTLEQASKGYQTLAVTGDATISWTNYSTGNIGQCAHLKLTGTLTSPAALTFPANMNWMSVNNQAGATVTIKCSGGTGVAVPTSRRVLIRCDGVDYVSDTPTWTGDSTTLTNNGDITNYLQVQTLIANAALPATAGTVLISGIDATANYIGNKITTTIGALTTTQVSGLSTFQIGVKAGASQKLQFTTSPGYIGGYLNGGVKTTAFTPVVGTEYTVGTAITIQLGSMTTPQVGQSFIVNQYNNVTVYYDSTINGQSSLFVNSNTCEIRKFVGGTWGWN